MRVQRRTRPARLTEADRHNTTHHPNFSCQHEIDSNPSNMDKADSHNSSNCKVGPTTAADCRTISSVRTDRTAKSDHKTNTSAKPDRHRSIPTKSDHRTRSITKSDQQTTFVNTAEQWKGSPTKAQQKCSATKPDQQKNSAIKPDQQKNSAIKPDQQKNSATKPDQQKGSTKEQKGSTIKAEQQKDSATKPEQQKGSATKPEQQKGSTTKPEQQKGSATKPEQQKGSTTQPEQQKGSATKPDQQEGATIKAKEQKGSTIKTEQQKGSTIKTEQQKGSTIKTEQQKDSATKPEQQEDSTTNPEQQKCSTTTPEQQKGSTTTTTSEQQKGSTINPEQKKGSAIKLEQQKSSAIKLEQLKGSAIKPAKEKGSAIKPAQQKGSCTRAEQKKGSCTRAEQKKGSCTRAEQKKVSSSKPEQQKGSTSKPEQQKGSTSKPEHKKGSTSKPEHKKGSAPKPRQQKGVATKPEQQNISTTKPEQQNSSATNSEKQKYPQSSFTHVEDPQSSFTHVEDPQSSFTHVEDPHSSFTDVEDPQSSSTPSKDPQSSSTPSKDPTSSSSPTEDPQSSSTPYFDTQTKDTFNSSLLQTAVGMAPLITKHAIMTEKRGSPLSKVIHNTQSVENETNQVTKLDCSTCCLLNSSKQTNTPHSLSTLILDQRHTPIQPKSSEQKQYGDESVRMDELAPVVGEMKHQLVKSELLEQQAMLPQSSVHDQPQLPAQNVRSHLREGLVSVKTEPPDEPAAGEEVAVRTEGQDQRQILSENRKSDINELEEEKKIGELNNLTLGNTEKRAEHFSNICKAPEEGIVIKSEVISSDTPVKVEASGCNPDMNSAPTNSDQEGNQEEMQPCHHIKVQLGKSRRVETEKIVQENEHSKSHHSNTGTGNLVTSENVSTGCKIYRESGPINEQVIVKSELKLECQSEKQSSDNTCLVTNEKRAQQFKQLERILITVGNEEQKEEVVKIELNEKQKTKDEWRSRYQRDSAKSSFEQQSLQATDTCGSARIEAAQSRGWGACDEKGRDHCLEDSDQLSQPLSGQPEWSTKQQISVQEDVESIGRNVCGESISREQECKARPRVYVIDVNRLKATPPHPQGEEEHANKHLCGGLAAVGGTDAGSEAARLVGESVLSRAEETSPGSSSEGKQIDQGPRRTKVVLQRKNQI